MNKLLNFLQSPFQTINMVIYPYTYFLSDQNK